MEVMRKTLMDIMAWDNETRFIIPSWQRHYVWGDKEVHQMWRDWREDCSRDLKHFCGVMLFKQLKESSTLSWEIVDGQQRMTTFFVFFIALRDVCHDKQIDFSELNGVFTTVGSRECRLILQDGVNEDREVLNALLNRATEQVEKAKLETSSLNAAYRIFISELNTLPTEEIPSFVVKILQNLDLVVLTVDLTDNTRRIFEALNSRGKQVAPDELVSNLITYIQSDDEELNQRARSTWDFISETFSDHDNALGDFLNAFGLRNGKQTERGTAFDEIKFELEIAQKENRVKDWLKEFKRAAKNYNEILFPDNMADPTQKLLSELKRLHVNKLNPFLLALLETFRDTPVSQSLLHNLLSAVVRLLVTFERPSYKLEKFTEKACGAFYEENGDRSVRLDKVIALIDDLWISDELFSKAFTAKTLYGSGAHLSRLRYYLEKFEQKISEQTYTPFEHHFGSQTTVEHIMPQTLDENGDWKKALRINDPIRLESQHRALVHTIGNLTVLLSKDNPAAGNTPYAKKREFYLHPDETLNNLGLRRRKISLGSCALNRYFEDVPTWNFQAIATRSQHLADLALQIWKKEDWNREIL